MTKLIGTLIGTAIFIIVGVGLAHAQAIVGVVL
jgi:hypothetical protein